MFLIRYYKKELKNMQSLVSVIIPAYNHEKYVQETIKSVIDQTYKNIELIIIDDGSPDKTLEKINELKEACEKRFVRFIVQTQDNQGTCVTMNKLLECVQGEYVYLIASDDKMSPDAIETLYAFLSQNEDYALAVGENLFIDGDSIQCYWDANKNNVYDLKDAVRTSFSDFLIKMASRVDFLSDEFGSYESLLIGNYIPNGYLIRKSIFEKIGYFTKDAPLEDYYLMLQISKYAKMKYINKPLFYYRWHGANTISRVKDMMELTRLTQLNELTNIANFPDPNFQLILLNHIHKNLSEILHR